MKKILYLSLCVLMIVLNIGCTKKSSDVTAVTTGLSFTAEIICGDIELVCNAKLKDGKSEFIIISPEEIKDLCYIFEDENITMSYKGLEYKVNCDLPETSALSLFCKILKNADKSKDKVTKKDDDFILSSSFDGNDYTIYLGESGLPIKVECKDKTLKAIIKNATILQ